MKKLQDAIKAGEAELSAKRKKDERRQRTEERASALHYRQEVNELKKHLGDGAALFKLVKQAVAAGQDTICLYRGHAFCTTYGLPTRGLAEALSSYGVHAHFEAGYRYDGDGQPTLDDPDGDRIMIRWKDPK